MKRLFLDDWRIPRDCATYMYHRADCRIFHEEWEIVRSYGEFSRWVESNGAPGLVAFDYDLADVAELKAELPIEDWFSIEEERVYTGLDCARHLLEYCSERRLPFPEYVIHSANPDGAEEIKALLEAARSDI